MIVKNEEQVIMYIKKPLNFYIPKEENEHSNKNPFSRHPSRELPQIMADDQNNQEKNLVVPKLFSGFKSFLKNKIWEIVKVPMPLADSSIGTPDNTKETSPLGLKSLWSEQSCIYRNQVSNAPSLSSFEQDIRLFQASLDYNKISPEMAENFEKIRKLPIANYRTVMNKRIILPESKTEQTKKVLLLDLDKTLVYTRMDMPHQFNEKDNRIWKKIKYLSPETKKWVVLYGRLRPGVKQFFQELKDMYEFVVFSSNERIYSVEVVKQLLDPNFHFIDSILTKEQCLNEGDNYIKDIRIISNRSVSNMILIDHSIISFANQLDNGIYIQSYNGDDEDNAIFPIIDFLKQIANCTNVQEEISKQFLLTELLRIYLKENCGKESSQ